MSTRQPRVIETDILVIGSGIAGLSTALAARAARVVVASPGRIGADGASDWARGGIAAAIGPDDAPALHARDTWDAGDRHGEWPAIMRVTEAAPAAIAWLADMGVVFDRDGDAISLGREAAHGRARIVHADGDATGHAVMAVLSAAVARSPSITTLDGHAALSLIGGPRRVHGAWLDDAAGERIAVLARHTVLATGGIGRLYRYTTNPDCARGDGIALALAAGARMRDLAFVQFHPTALAVGDGTHPLPLLTEALRGAGAWLVDGANNRFMREISPQAELAPRDVVARAVYAASRHGPVFLDARHAPGADLARQFPRAWDAASNAGLDPRHQLLPVMPAAHYHMGGVATDELGATSVPGLYAVGEVACNGVHGANRLASNSLLEGVVVGRALGARLAGCRLGPRPQAPEPPPADASWVDAELELRVRECMWRHVGVERTADGLRAAIDELAVLARGRTRSAARAGVALAITRDALARPCSRGAHHRADAPGTVDNPAHAASGMG